MALGTPCVKLLLISSSNGGEICLSPKRLHLFPGTAKAAVSDQDEEIPQLQSRCRHQHLQRRSDLQTVIHKSCMLDLAILKPHPQLLRHMHDKDPSDFSIYSSRQHTLSHATASSCFS
jgi:hypothetical protein